MSTSTIDPRIRARRIAVQRDEGRRRLRVLAIASGAAAVVLGVWGITLTPVLDVDHLEVIGATSTGVAAVEAATDIVRGDALLTADVGRAADRIAALPWVQTVEVERKWPGTVRISVIERVPAAAVPVKAGGWVLLDATGRQLAVVPEPGPGVLRILLPPVVAEPGVALARGSEAALELATTRPATLQERLIALRPAAAGAVEGTVRLRNGAEATVRFGRPTQMTAKWLALLTVLDATDPARLATIDLRVPAAPALTRR